VVVVVGGGAVTTPLRAPSARAHPLAASPPPGQVGPTLSGTPSVLDLHP